MDPVDRAFLVFIVVVITGSLIMAILAWMRQ